jgi:cytochrome c
MKKMLLPMFALALLASCGGGESNDGKPAAAATAEKPKDPAYQIGLELVGKNDCLTCHKINEAFTGPSYSQVAEKYAGADAAKITEIAEKVIKGGTGVWGSAIMTPHASLSQEDAEAMVKYILLLKK